MDVLEIKSLAIAEVKAVRCGRFRDNRGYFIKHYRRGSPPKNPFHRVEFVQRNENFSHAGVMRELYSQWNRCVAKLVLAFLSKDSIEDIIANLHAHRAEYGDFSRDKVYNFAVFRKQFAPKRRAAA